jgi:hypothetical protein
VEFDELVAICAPSPKSWDDEPVEDEDENVAEDGVKEDETLERLGRLFEGATLAVLAEDEKNEV